MSGYQKLLSENQRLKHVPKTVEVIPMREHFRSSLILAIALAAEFTPDHTVTSFMLVHNRYLLSSS